MKFLMIIGTAQFILMSVVLIKLFAVDAQLPESNTRSVDQASAEAKFDSAANAPYLGLTEVQIRSIIRQELAEFANHQLRGAEPEATLLAADDSVENAVDSILPGQLEELQVLETRVDYLLGDGEYSAADMHEIEGSLATLPPELRQKLLNRLAKSMTKSNTSFTR